MGEYFKKDALVGTPTKTQPSIVVRKVFTLSPQYHSDNEEEHEMRDGILLTAQVALLGEVPFSLRALTLGWSSSLIYVRSIFDGEISEDDRESLACVATEIIAGFNHNLEEEFIRLDAPASMDHLLLKVWSYKRKERGPSS